MKAEDYVHRIGRTGRAGRAGLAITLAERRDVGMIRRIERFTTQPITTAVVVGLEPKLPEPSATRPAFSPRGGKPGFGGGRGGYGNNGGFGGGRPDQGAPRNYGGGGGFRGRDDNQGAPRDNGYQGGGGFRDGNQGGGFRDDNRAAAPRGPFDRSGPRTGAGAGPNDRGPRPAGPRGFAGKPAFGPRRTPR
jgi:hypothetical protein